MKFLTNKKVIKKIAILCIALLIFNFICPPNKANAWSFTGMLVDPLVELLILIPVAVYNIVQYFVLGEWVGVSITQNDLTMKLSPALIFSNNVPLLDINFINPKTEYTIKDENGTPISIINQETIDNKSIAAKATGVIGKWYTTLRYIAIIGLLIVLVYLGIKMLLTTVSSKKAQYKQMLTDWFVALILVITLHYFMAGLLTIVDKISEGLGSSTISVYKGPSGTYSDADMLESFVIAKEGYEARETLGENLSIYDTEDEAGEWALKIGYLVVFWALFIYTLIFLFQYLKRVLYMAFLTVISPMVCLTYPIDKVNDGSAQAFNMWFKEYVFNALIQPFHLLIYVVFMGIARDMNNVIITIVVLGFMIPAEKLLRKMFGFDKASTNGAFLGAAAGSMLMDGIKHIGGKPPKAPGEKGGDTGDDKKVRVSRTNEANNLAGYRGENADNQLNSSQDTVKTANNKENEDGISNEQYPSKELSEEKRKELAMAAGIGDSTEDGENKLFNTSEPENNSANDKEESENNRKGENLNNSDNSKETIPNGKIRRGATPVRPAQNSIRRNIAGIAKRQGRKAKRYFARKGIHSVGGAVLKGMGAGAKGLAKAYVAAGAGAVGLAAGIVTGDPSKAVAFGLGGAAVGSKVGEKAFNKVVPSGSKMYDLGNEILHGETAARNKRAEIEQQREEKAYMRSENTWQRAQELQDTLFKDSTLNEDGTPMTTEDVAKMMYKYEQAGITDDADIKKGMQLQKKRGASVQQAAGVLQRAKNVSYEQLMNPDSRHNTMMQFQNQSQLTEAGAKEAMADLDFIKGIDTEDANRAMNEKYPPKQSKQNNKPKVESDSKKKKKIKSSKELLSATEPEPTLDPGNSNIVLPDTKEYNQTLDDMNDKGNGKK